MAVYAGSLNFKMAVLLKFEDGGKFTYGGNYKMEVFEIWRFV
jgi:hypothetical protein